MGRSRLCEIENNLGKELRVDLEPLTLSKALPVGASIYVESVIENSTFTVRVGTDDKNELCLAIWPGDGEINVTDASGKAFFDDFFDE